MGKGIVRTAGLVCLVGTVLTVGAVRNAAAEVSVSINIGPPPIVAPAPPEVVLMPRMGVYFVPGLSFDVFFYNGYWWSPRGDRWYRSRAYGGPWRIIDRRYVPRPVFGVPHDYRRTYERERRIPYGQWKKEHERRGRGERREWRDERRDERRQRMDERRDEGRERRHDRGRGRD